MQKQLLSLLSIGAATTAAMAQNRPNIVLFLVDDMGWQESSVPFHADTTMWNRHFETPNMERLAAKGVKFTNAYAAPVSSPSRISLLTGVNPTRHKVTNWTLRKNIATDGQNRLLTFEQWHVNGFSPKQGIEHTYYGTPLAQILQNNGYATLFVGKAHFGAIDTPAENPLNVGFEKSVGGHAAGGPGSYLSEKHYGNSTSGSPWGVPHLEQYYDSGTFLTEALTLESIKMMDEAVAEKRPFFLYLAHYAVHVPFEVDNRFYQKYIDKGVEEQEARFASMIEGMDKSLGDIMDYLEERGIDENTIVLFMSDNGGYTVGLRRKTFNGINKMAPLRGGKGSLYEGGTREPMLVYMPRAGKKGLTNHSQVIIEDFFPSILEMAGIKSPKMVQKLDSKSFVEAVKGKLINKNRPLYWHYPNDWGERNNDCGAPSSSIVIGNMKFIHFYETATNELYNLNEDLSESNNLIGQGAKYDKMAKRMAKTLSNKLRAEGSTLPRFREDNRRCPYPDETL